MQVHNTEYGTVRRGRGTKVHLGHRYYRMVDGRQAYVSIGADCNSNGSNAGRDFQAGYDRNVTCSSCNPGLRTIARQAAIARAA
jgi:hypothetical protein